MRLIVGVLITLFAASASTASDVDQSLHTSFTTAHNTVQESANSPYTKDNIADVISKLSSGNSNIGSQQIGNFEKYTSKKSSSALYIYKDANGMIVLGDQEPKTNFNKYTAISKMSCDKSSEGIAVDDYLSILSKRPNAKIGMTKKQVIQDTRWGCTHSIKTITDSTGNLEIWDYSHGDYLYFKNGKLIRIED